MKRLFKLTFFLVLAACGLRAQAVNTTVCDVLKSPQAFDGKMVTIKGTAVVGFDQFVLNDGPCAEDVNGIWLAYPPGSKAKAAPEVVVELAPAKNFAGTATAATRTPVTLTKDKTFKQFDSALAATHSNGTMCLGCARYTVQATITGRLDGVQSTLIKRDGGKIVGLGGFGNLNQYPARLVIASVADVSTKEIDYSKSDALAKTLQKVRIEQPQGSPGQPPSAGSSQDAQGAAWPGQAGALGQPTSVASIGVARDSADKVVAKMAPSALTSQMQKDISQLPKLKEQNGVNLVSATMNEVPANEGTAGTVESPDGVLYNCALNRDRMLGGDLTVALMHVAQHIADVRAPLAGNEAAPLAILEGNAWAVGTTVAIYSGQKSVTLPGGYVMWNSTWPQADQVGNMQAVLADFLSQEEQLNR